MADDGGPDATIAALEQLYRTDYSRFLRLARAFVGSRPLAEDVVQEAFARAVRNSADLRELESLGAWVWRTVTNVAISQGKRARATEADELGELTGPSNGFPAESAELRAAIAALPERQRQALFLRHYADLSYQEIGDVLGIARGTVSATLHAAHGSLRATLAEVRL